MEETDTNTGHSTQPAVFGLCNTWRKSEQSKTHSKLCILGLGTQKPSPRLLHFLPQSIRTWGFLLQPETPRTPLRHGQLSWQCSAGQSRGAGAGPSRSCQAVAWIWSRPLPGPCSEPFPYGFSFTHVAVAQCQEAAAPQDRRHQWCSTSCGASSARAAQWGAGCCPAPACLAARDYLASCSGQGPTPHPTWLSPDSALVTDHGDQPQPPTSPLARWQQR